MNFFILGRSLVDKLRLMVSGGKSSLSWRLILPVPIAITVCIIAIALLVPKILSENAEAEAIRQGQQIVNQFKTIRGYYTNSVIKKAVKNGTLKPTIDHKDTENGIPLPATLIYDISALLSKSDLNVSLYSAFPFDNRKGRVLSDFQQQAWDFLTANPDDVFSRRETLDGKEIVRVAISDKMVAKGCVACHNSRADSPKTDWKLGDVRGVLEVASVIAPQLAAGEAIANKMVIAAIIIGIILTAVAMLGAKSVTGPLLSTINAMNRLAEGQMDVEILGLKRRDEIGEMAGAMQVFKTNAVERANLMTQSDKAQKTRADRQLRFENHISTFRETVLSVLGSVATDTGKMEATAKTLSSIATQTTEKATSVAGASEEASQNTQAVAAATEELTASIGEISGQINHTKTIVEKAGVATRQTDTRITGLAKAAQKIDEVVSLIQGIAEQTNLLALNATIEAARAGEAGRGFAVVASEVKELATQTAKATEEISDHISGIQRETESSVEAIRGIGETMAEVSAATEAVAAAVREQGESTSEISQNVQQAASGSNEVAQNINGVSQAADESLKSADQMLKTAQDIASDTQKLQTIVDEFLEDVATA